MDPRFSTIIAEYLYSLQPDKEKGSKEDIGWHGLFLGDLVGENFEALEPDEQEEVNSAAAAILSEDEDGFVDAALFETRNEADRVWEGIEDDYAEFFDSKEDMNTPHAASKVNPDDPYDENPYDLTKTSYTTSAKNEIVKLFSAKPGFPKDDEAGIDTLLKGLEKLIPAKVATGSGKHKSYLVYLCKQLFGLPRPSFIQGEDDERVKGTLEAFEDALTSQALPPDKRDLTKFQTIGDIQSYLDSLSQEKEEGQMTIATLPESMSVSKNITTPGNPKADIAAGSKVIASTGGWELYEIKKNAAGSPERIAAGWLGANEIWNVGWCVGRDRSQDQVDYQTNGDFWFCAQNGRPRYAISSNSNGATIWDSVDNISWETQNSRTSTPKNVDMKAKELGVTVGNISSIPAELIDILAAGVKASPTLAEVVPVANLSVDFSGLDQVVKALTVDELIADINAGASSNVATALLIRAIAVKKSFTGHWDNFSEDGITAFINAWSAAGMRNLPPDLEQAFIDDAPNFKF